MTDASSPGSEPPASTAGLYARCARRTSGTSPSSRVPPPPKRRGFVLACVAVLKRPPFCPAWRGSRAIVERAARLIAEEGALDGEETSVEGLAEGVGVGARHLARLFSRHLGAPPSQVARTARVQRAKRLLDDTDSPMTEIAGFGSLRRFNTVFSEVYGRPPSGIRRTRLPRRRDVNVGGFARTPES